MSTDEIRTGTGQNGIGNGGPVPTPDDWPCLPTAEPCGTCGVCQSPSACPDCPTVPDMDSTWVPGVDGHHWSCPRSGSEWSRC